MNSNIDRQKDAATDPRLLLLSPGDNVLVLRGAIDSGEQVLIQGIQITVKEHIGIGHKLAALAIPMGSKVLKYGAPIGSATCDIAVGDHVHTNNIKSDYTATLTLENEKNRHQPVIQPKGKSA